MKRTIVRNEKKKDHNIKAKLSIEISNAVNINLTFCGIYLWSWIKERNWYK